MMETVQGTNRATFKKVKDKLHKCPDPLCDAVFIRPFKLRAHLNVHIDNRPFRCEFKGCNKAYTRNFHLLRHVRISHEEKAFRETYKCPIEGCSQECQTISNIRRHIERIHTRKYPHMCKTCGKHFRKSDQLKTHEHEHTGIFPFRCELCDVGYYTAYFLRKHNRKHKKRSCQHCDLEFKDGMLLRKHIGLQHRKSYNCSTCGKLFYNKALLAMHEVVHLDPSQRVKFHCPYEKCSRYYYAQRNVNYHVRVFHEGKRNKQKCPLCGKELYNRQKLKDHLKLHPNMAANEVILPTITEGTIQDIVKEEQITSDEKPELPSASECSDDHLKRGEMDIDEDKSAINPVPNVGISELAIEEKTKNLPEDRLPRFKQEVCSEDELEDNRQSSLSSQDFVGEGCRSSLPKEEEVLLPESVVIKSEHECSEEQPAVPAYLC